MSSVYYDFVGGFWRPKKLSKKRCAKIFKDAMRVLGDGPKPRVRFVQFPTNGGLFMAVYRP